MLIPRPVELVDNRVRSFASSRHKSNCNFSFTDGSAVVTPIENLWQLSWSRTWAPTETVAMPAN